MNKKNNDLYLEQKHTNYFVLIICLIFIIGLMVKTIYNDNSLQSIQNALLLCLPIPFMNTSFWLILKVYKNILTNNKVFTKQNSKILNMLMISIFVFFLSILTIITKDTMGMHSLYCLIIIGIYFLYMAYLIKRIFNYGMELK